VLNPSHNYGFRTFNGFSGEACQEESFVIHRPGEFELFGINHPALTYLRPEGAGYPWKGSL